MKRTLNDLLREKKNIEAIIIRKKLYGEELVKSAEKKKEYACLKNEYGKLKVLINYLENVGEEGLVRQKERLLQEQEVLSVKIERLDKIKFTATVVDTIREQKNRLKKVKDQLKLISYCI